MVRRAGSLIAIAVLATVAVADEPVLRSPSTAPPSFNPMPELWGLSGFDEQTTLEDLDRSFVLYVAERARFEVDAPPGRVYLAGGRQLVAASSLAPADRAAQLRTHGCLCALDYELGVGRELDVAAGVYRLDGPPVVAAEGDAIVRVELAFAAEGQADRVRLRRLTCWSKGSRDVLAVQATLPPFAVLTRKVNTGFADPDPDDREVTDQRSFRHTPTGRDALVLHDFTLSTQQARRIPERFDAPELLGTARPGLLTLLGELTTGQRRAIDHADYFRVTDPYLQQLDRRQGIIFRDPWAWP
jgi:hypothetical protein